MKKIILVALLAFLASRFWSEYPIARAGGVSGHGDVNGDNGLDLSDAIYLLTHLFQGGPAPLACPAATETNCNDNMDNDGDNDTDCDDTDCDADPSCQGIPEICDNATDDDLDGDTDCADADCVLLAGCDIVTDLPATGVTSCYDENGQAIACAGTGQDAEYQAGCRISPRFELDSGPDGLDDRVDSTTRSPTCAQGSSGHGGGSRTVPQVPQGGPGAGGSSTAKST